jgi:hypothetical protein
MANSPDDTPRPTGFLRTWHDLHEVLGHETDAPPSSRLPPIDSFAS